MGAKRGSTRISTLILKMSNDSCAHRRFCSQARRRRFLFYVRLQKLHFALTRAAKEQSPAQQSLAAVPSREFLSFADVSILEKASLNIAAQERWQIDGSQAQVIGLFDD